MKAITFMSIAFCASNFISVSAMIRPGFIASTRFSRCATHINAEAKVNPQESTVPIVESMPAPLPPLNNYYYLLRHGQSTANVEGIISSARSLAGSTKHGLTLLGEQQGIDSAGPLIDLIQDDVKNGELESTKKVYFYSSPFARAKETAYACLKGIEEGEVKDKVNTMGLDVGKDVAIEDRLMERYFGRLDGKELATYAYVWPGKRKKGLQYSICLCTTNLC